MTATYMQRQYHSRGIGWMFALIALLVAAYLIAAAAVQMQNHADLKHGAEAELVRQCIQKNGVLDTWVKPDGRRVDICNVPDGRYGLHIYALDDNGTVHEITAFIKNKFHSFDQVSRYLKNCGAEPLR